MWNEIYLKGFQKWIDDYKLGVDYQIDEMGLSTSLMRCFEVATKEEDQPFSGEIQRERQLVGNTRVDFTFGNEVALEVDFEPYYPGIPIARKPVTNVFLKEIDREVAELAGLTGEESKMRLYEIELDFLKLIACKKRGIPHNYLFCLDEDGWLFRNLENIFRTRVMMSASVPWKPIQRGKDGRIVHYFIWQT